MLEITGCGTALITPFGLDYAVDYDAFRVLVRRQIESGIHFLVPLGTTGETPCLEDDEKIRLLDITNEEAQGRLPVIAGAGSNYTKHVISNIRLLDKHGADAFLVVVPYYNKPTQGGIYLHFKAIAESTDKPIILYNVPGRTGVNMTAETTLKLAEIENIISVKEASANSSQISEIIRNAPAGFNVLSGNDDETLSIISGGGKGLISVASNVAPAHMSRLVSLLLEKRITEAEALNARLAPLYTGCFVESNPIPVKAALSKMGYIENILRLPLTPSNKATLDLMGKLIAELELA